MRAPSLGSNCSHPPVNPLHSGWRPHSCGQQKKKKKKKEEKKEKRAEGGNIIHPPLPRRTPKIDFSHENCQEKSKRNWDTEKIRFWAPNKQKEKLKREWKMNEREWKRMQENERKWKMKEDGKMKENEKMKGPKVSESNPILHFAFSCPPLLRYTPKPHVAFCPIFVHPCWVIRPEHHLTFYFIFVQLQFFSCFEYFFVKVSESNPMLHFGSSLSGN